MEVFLTPTGKMFWSLQEQCLRYKGKLQKNLQVSSQILLISESEPVLRKMYQWDTREKGGKSSL